MADLQDLLPVPDDASAPFFEAAREGRLLLQRCPDCGLTVFPHRARCTACGRDGLEWLESKGHGVVYMHGVARRAFHPELQGALPWVLAVVELDEGARMTTNLVGVEPDSVHAGMRVQVRFEPVSDEISIPKFEPEDRA